MMKLFTAALIAVPVLIAGFVPTVHAAVIPGTSLQPALWLEANQGVTTSGSSVTNWADQSGNGRDATVPGGSTAPTLVSGVQTGLGATAPVIRFNGANDALAGLTAGLTLNGVEGFVVARLDGSSAANDGVFNLATGANADYQVGGVIVWSAGFTPPNNPSGAAIRYNIPSGWTGDNLSLPVNNFYIYDMNVLDGGGVALGNASVENTFTQADTSLVAGANGGAFSSLTPNYYALGARALGSNTVGFNAKVDIAAVILFGSPLSAPDRAAVQAYLTSEYVPEPASLSLLALCVSAVALRRGARHA